ncbi:hypothetical protein AAG570_004861 [Ranatra chinensis]|uniref:Probable ATP-dependent RNA helicase DDX52 n=1 Tax=Ranatra chinensis TaxID=642074 RepID=A0ABD0XYR5_9HEMI
MAAMCDGRQVLVCAPTGSGKTAAFLIPLIANLGVGKGLRALVLCPSRELAKQTYRECIRLSAGTGVRPHIISKVSMSDNKFGPKFSLKFDLLIGTPNRLIYLLKREDSGLDLSSLKWLVIDESDKLFESGVKGFGDQLQQIYEACDPAVVKRALFSATYTIDVARWCKHNLKDLVTIIVGQRNTTADQVEQELVFVGNENGKLIAFRELVQKGLTPPVLVFVQSKERAKELFDELIYDNINVDVIHADRPQLQRDNVVQAFREGKIWVLICTELMGRGIDFKGVRLVVNYDFPNSAISYIHRIGRTGRAGRPGKALTFFTEDDRDSLRSISAVMKESGCPVPDYMLKLKKPKSNSRKRNQVIEREQISTQLKKKRKWKKENKTQNEFVKTTATA